ncbi:MAG: cytochrome P450 [Candidatus Acidiferrales bacterium]
MSKNGHRKPPGPRGLPLLGVALEVRRDALRSLQRYARDYGDVVVLPVLDHRRIFVNRPDLIQQMLLFQQSKLHKSDLTKEVVGPLLGHGLLISEGDFWRRQRRLAQPAFHKQRVNEYSSTMVECAETQTRGWQEGQRRDVAEEMMALTLESAVRTLFGTTLPGEAEGVGRAMTFLMRYSLARARAPIRIPASWPTKTNLRSRREFKYMDSLIYRIIGERQAQAKGSDGDAHGNSSERSDLLSMLMGAMDEDGSCMTPQQLRDETMTLFIAGHETTALTLAWTWYALSQNPAAETRLHRELDSVLGGRKPEATDLERLPYLSAVVSEVLRLYPAAYIMARTTIDEVRLDVYEFSPGTTILFSQWVMHRDPRYYEAPEEFRPERWLEGLAARLPAGAYFPFGDGPRRCIGQGFALLETSLVVATIAQRFRFRLIANQKVAPEPLVTLRPHNGIQMTVHAR